MLKTILIFTLLVFSQTQRIVRFNEKKPISDRILDQKPSPPLSEDEKLQKDSFQIVRAAGQAKFKADYPKEKLTLVSAYQQLVSGIVYTLNYKTDQTNIYEISIYYVIWLREQKDRIQHISIRKTDKI